MKLILDCRDGMTAIHEQLAQALSFPCWYGNNLDALHDCLTATTETVQITLLEPELLPGLYRVLKDCANENPQVKLEI